MNNPPLNPLPGGEQKGVGYGHRASKEQQLVDRKKENIYMAFMKKIFKKKSFTLIELLTVMAISIILMAIAIPAFNTLTKGQKVETAARTIGSQLKAVRSYAITHREYVALIIPTTESLPSEYLYKSYRACIVDSSNVFEYWVSGEKWEFMPTGTAILEIDNSADLDTVKNFGSAEDIDEVDFSSIGGADSVDGVKGLIFTSTGKCVGASASGIFVNVGDAISLESGITKTSNQIDIKIDLYSGRISYGSN